MNIDEKNTVEGVEEQREIYLSSVLSVAFYVELFLVYSGLRNYAKLWYT